MPTTDEVIMSYVQKPENVSGNARVTGNAYVSGDARVYGNAYVYGDAYVYGNAHVYGDACVSGNAHVSGNAYVYGDAYISRDACVSGNACVYGDARVSGNADILVIGPAISSGRYTTAHTDSVIGVRVNTGCFSGTVEEFIAAIERTHKDNAVALRQYRGFVAAIKAHFWL